MKTYKFTFIKNLSGLEDRFKDEKIERAICATDLETAIATAERFCGRNTLIWLDGFEIKGGVNVNTRYSLLRYMQKSTRRRV